MTLAWELRGEPPCWIVTRAEYSAMVVQAPTGRPLVHALVYSLSTNSLILSRDFGTIEAAQSWVENLFHNLGARP